MTDKVCKYCSTTKPIEEFSKNKGSKDGYNYKCKACQSNYFKTEEYPILKEKRSVMVKCECGKEVQTYYYNRHLNSPLHMKRLAKVKPEDALQVQKTTPEVKQKRQEEETEEEETEEEEEEEEEEGFGLITLSGLLQFLRAVAEERVDTQGS